MNVIKLDKGLVKNHLLESEILDIEIATMKIETIEGLKQHITGIKAAIFIPIEKISAKELSGDKEAQ